MSNKETVEREIGLTFDFIRQIIKDPSILDNIPDGAIIEFIDDDFPIKEGKSYVRPDKYLKVTNEFQFV